MIAYASLKPSEITCSPFDFQVAEYCLLSHMKIRKDTVHAVCQVLEKVFEKHPEQREMGIISAENVRRIIVLAKRITRDLKIKKRDISRFTVWNALNESDNFSHRGLAVALMQHLLHESDISDAIRKSLRFTAKNMPDRMFTSPIKNFLEVDSWTEGIEEEFLETMKKLDIKTYSDLLGGWGDWLWEHCCEHTEEKHVFNLLDVLSGSLGVPLFGLIGRSKLYEGLRERIEENHKK